MPPVIKFTLKWSMVTIAISIISFLGYHGVKAVRFHDAAMVTTAGLNEVKLAQSNTYTLASDLAIRVTQIEREKQLIDRQIELLTQTNHRQDIRLAEFSTSHNHIMEALRELKTEIRRIQ